jgi:hypothetical protein
VYRFDTNVRFRNRQKKAGELETLGLRFQLACFVAVGLGVRALWSVASSVPIERPEDSQRSSRLHDLPLLLPANMRLFLPAPNTRNCLFFVSAPRDAFNRIMGRADCVPKRRRAIVARASADVGQRLRIAWLEAHDTLIAVRSGRFLELYLMQPSVEFTAAEKLVVGANVGDSARLHDEDPIGQCQRR